MESLGHWKFSGWSSQDFVDTGFGGASLRFKLLRAHALEMIVTALLSGDQGGSARQSGREDLRGLLLC